MIFLIATHNQKKKQELQRILQPLGIDIKTADEAGVELSEVDETGTTFEENALLKARSGCNESGLTTIADDSGLCVDALGGAPGIYSARYAGEHGKDGKNIEKLLDALKDVEEKDRTARFVCAACCAFPDGTHITVRGECEGKIAFEKKGNGGFGYDPVFLVGNKSFGEIPAAQKDSISHRSRALTALANELRRKI
ncbi:MAG: RdgB/HAM1 family non-canonical purine NTP pyrophosphatase [Oscillospiraceae bacterium]